MADRVENKKYITDSLAEGMRKVVHIDTGYLKSTIYSDTNMAGAKARYAGFEEERGGSHSFATKAIDGFDVEAYIDYLVEPF